MTPTTATDPSFVPPARHGLLQRIDGAALAWAGAAAALSVGVGLLAGANSMILLDIALVVAAGVAFVWRPYEMLLLLLLLRATLADSAFLDLGVLVGGGLALLVTRSLPAKRVSVPFLLLLIIAIASVPGAPSADEGPKDVWLELPKTAIPYLPTPSNELFEWLRLASLFVIFCLAATVIRDAKRLRTLVAVALVAAVGPLFIGIQQLITGDTTYRSGVEAIRGPFEHPNYFAFYLLVVLSFGTVAFLEERRPRRRMALAALLAAGGLCLFMTYTRAAWVGAIAILLLLAMLRYRRLWAVGAVALVAVLAAFPSVTGTVEDRFDTVSETTPEGRNSWTWRKKQWTRMIPYGYEEPITGQGFGSYTRTTVREFGTTGSLAVVQDPDDVVGGPRGFAAHNDYVKMFVEMGLPGLALWVTVLVMLLVSVLMARRKPGVGPQATAAAAFLVVLLGVSASDNLQGYTVVGACALALAGGVIGVRSNSSIT